MLKWILVLFVVVPLIELYLMLSLGSLIGFWPTIAIVVVTGIVGGALAKHEGIKVWQEWRRALDELRPPDVGVIDGVLVLVGGALLITPGVLTDLAGVALLVPWTRRKLAARIRQSIDRRLADGRIQVISASPLADLGRGEVVNTTGEARDE